MSHATTFGSLVGASKLRLYEHRGPNGVTLGGPQREYDRVRLAALARARKAREARFAAMMAAK